MVAIKAFLDDALSIRFLLDATYLGYYSKETLDALEEICQANQARYEAQAHLNQHQRLHQNQQAQAHLSQQAHQLLNQRLCRDRSRLRSRPRC